MIENFVILSNSEVEKYRSKPWFDIEVFKLINTCGYENYLVPKERLNDKPELIDELIADFDWVEVKKVMEALDWKWWGKNEVPTCEEMQKMVRELYSAIESRVNKNEYAFCASGGFKLTFNPDEDNELSLVFEAVTGVVYK